MSPAKRELTKSRKKPATSRSSSSFAATGMSMSTVRPSTTSALNSSLPVISGTNAIFRLIVLADTPCRVSGMSSSWPAISEIRIVGVRLKPICTGPLTLVLRSMASLSNCSALALRQGSSGAANSTASAVSGTARMRSAIKPRRARRRETPDRCIFSVCPDARQAGRPLRAYPKTTSRSIWRRSASPPGGELGRTWRLECGHAGDNVVHGHALHPLLVTQFSERIEHPGENA